MITVKDHKIVYDYDTNKDLKTKKDGIFTLKKFVRIRTNTQNRYLWGGVYEYIFRNTGTEKDVIHEQMGYKFLKDNSGKYPRIKSTTELSTVEFIKFVDEIILLWSEEGYYFPTIEQYKEMF